MAQGSPVSFKKLTAVAALLVVAGCAAPAPPPPPPPPPPPVVEIIPDRPTPPRGAVANFLLPMTGPDGVRQTVNAYLSPAQMTWNVRSALNVAALNCREPNFERLTANYASFLERHKSHLSETNRTLRQEFRDRHGPKYLDEQDVYMTRVYNYFALPLTRNHFCSVAHDISEEALVIEPDAFPFFTAQALPRIETVFDQFYSEYETYLVELAAWDARYGPQYPVGPAIGGASGPMIQPLPTEGPIVQPLPSSGPIVQPLPDNTGDTPG